MQKRSNVETFEHSNIQTLAIIPARGGSKGIPGKNIRLLAGKPLLAYTAEAARASRLIRRTILSTDSEEIAACGRALGLEVPFRRPAELAQDDTPTLPVVLHALDWLKTNEGYQPDIVVLLQPTAPLRRARHIDEAVSLLIESGADSVVSVAPVPGHFHPKWQFVIRKGGLYTYEGTPLADLPTRRQNLEPTYTRDGAIYAVRCSALEKHTSLFGRRTLAYVMPPQSWVNLDLESDWRLAELLLQ